MRRDELVDALDGYFRVPDVANDAAWGEIYDGVLEAPYWREYADAAYPTRWNGLFVRGRDEVERVVTCVFPSDEIVAALEPGTFLFSEHPVGLAPPDMFTPLARSSFETLRRLGLSFYHVHGPLDQHPEVSPSRLLAHGLGIDEFEEFFPIVEGIPGGAVVAGDSELALDELAARAQAFLGEEVPVVVYARPHEHAGRVAIAGGGGAQPEVLEAALARGCETFVTGNAASSCPLAFVQEELRQFRTLAAEAGVALVDGTHYGTEKPPQLAMVEWFERLGVPARFAPGRPERDA